MPNESRIIKPSRSGVTVSRKGGIVSRQGGTVRRAQSLGQLDEEMDYGPSPLQARDVPPDLWPRFITNNRSDAFGAGEAPVDQNDLSQLISDVHAIAGTMILRRGLLGRVVTVTATPSLLVQAHEPRGYLFLNPAGVVGLTASATVFSSTTTTGATTVTSGSVGVANYKSVRFFLVIDFTAGSGPVTFDLQSLDPVTETYVTTQTIFSVTVDGSYYAFVDMNGIDTDFQIFVTVPAATTVTYTLGAILKDGLLGTSAGVTQTIFLGGAGVAHQSGYPLLAGNEKRFFVMENVNIWAVTAGPNLDMNIFEM